MAEAARRLDPAAAPPAADAPDRAASAGVARGRYLSELESLRGLAILLVVLFHIEGVLYMPLRRPAEGLEVWQSFIRAGHTGVSLFFVLSAFLLSLPFWQEARGGPYLSLAQYARRRALRILPLYWVAVAVATVLTAHSLADLGRFVPHALFLSSVYGAATPMPLFSDVWWSLATEVQFYCLLPLLPLCRRHRHGVWIGLALLGAAGGFYLLFLAGIVKAQTYEGHYVLADSIVGRWPQFVTGAAAAWLYLRLRDLPWRAPAWWRNGGADLALLATFTALALLLRWVTEGGNDRFISVPFQGWRCIEGGLWSIIVLLVLLAPLRTKRLWDNAAWERLGLLSYSLYMWHVPIAWHLIPWARRAGVVIPSGWSVRGVLATIVVGALCLALSALTYRWIERPFLIRKARLH